MASLVPLLALLSIGGWPTTFPHFRITLAFDARIPAVVARGAVAEAAALWAPYGVAIAQLDPSAVPGAASGRLVDAALTVRVAEPSPDTARAWSSPFGSIRFLPDGAPEPTLLLHYDAVLKLGVSTVSLGGTREPQWPGAVRDRVLGRMIGRVVAHEIGHYLLRTRDHSPSGLMRAHQTTDELADPGREGLMLPPSDFARLRACLTGSHDQRRDCGER
jgi:hypothetical protein